METKLVLGFSRKILSRSPRKYLLHNQNRFKSTAKINDLQRYKPVIRGCFEIQSVAQGINLMRELFDDRAVLESKSASALISELVECTSEQSQYRKMPDIGARALWFRGQPNIEWSLTPSIFRQLDGGLDENNSIFHLTSIRPDLRNIPMLDVLTYCSTPWTSN